MESTVVGFCVRVDGHISYLACPYCFAHLCDAYGAGLQHESDGSSSDDAQVRDDAAFNCLRSIAGSEYAQVTLQDMWIAVSSFRELDSARVGGRPFGLIGDFQRVASVLAWDVPSGVVVVHLEKQKALIFRDGQVPTDSGVYSALIYLRRNVALGLLIYGEGKFAFLENHWGPGRIRTTYRRMIRETVASWDD